jgi:hypothetical protein
MAAADEFLGEVMNDPFGTSIAKGWDTLMERGDLRYSHINLFAFF